MAGKAQRARQVAILCTVFAVLLGGALGYFLGPPPWPGFRLGFFGLPDPLIGASVYGFALGVLAWLAVSAGMKPRDP